jgi:nucleoside-diphosphate-sugar epimerase
MILVTGAGGHLGANLLRRLVADGESVRALLHTARDEPTLAGLRVERMTGDLRDPAVAEAAAAGCRQIYHCAAKVSTTYGDRDEIFACNVVATRNVLRAAATAGIEKVVVTGSFSAVGHRRDGPSDESVPFNPLERHLPYGHTKAAVEHECLKACAEGLPVVVAVSTAILGPWDFKPSRMGQVLIRFARGRLRAYVPGGFTFVAARDIVEGHVLAMAKGRPGQKYIFASEFLSFDEIMGIFARVTGRPVPPLRVPPALMAVIAEIAAAALPYLAPKAEQLLTPAAIRILRLNRRADISKGERDLGFRPTPIAGAVQDAYDWFVARGLIERAAGRAVASAELRP